GQAIVGQFAQGTRAEARQGIQRQGDGGADDQARREGASRRQAVPSAGQAMGRGEGGDQQHARPGDGGQRVRTEGGGQTGEAPPVGVEQDRKGRQASRSRRPGRPTVAATAARRNRRSQPVS